MMTNWNFILNRLSLVFLGLYILINVPEPRA